MHTDKKIIITGGSGQVGRHLRDIMPNATYLSSSDYNLMDKTEVDRMLDELKPDVIVHLAAKVGGITDNINHPTEFFYNNIMMNSLLLEGARKRDVGAFIGILSTCIYPDKLSDEMYPMTEDLLHVGPPAPTNFSYGYSKRCMAVHIDCINKQYDKNYQYLIPSNLYGEYEKFNEKSHFIGALLLKMKHALESGSDKITLLGDGTPLRQFMYAGDLAQTIKMCIEHDIKDSFNVATDEVLSIRQIAEIALKTCGLDLRIEWTGEHAGQHKKDVSIDKMMHIIPDFRFTKLEDGIKKTWDALLKNKQ